MSDAMQLLSLDQLFDRIGKEYRAANSVFGIHADTWFSPTGSQRISFAREACDVPLGPAAGPHTQLSQNIVSAYLTGSRFFELKTVQILDQLEIDKPCIDAADEGYNVEWSTELRLDDSWREYARAWIALHALDEIFRLKNGGGSSPNGAAEQHFVFNMSIGYNLEGIMQPPMQEYLDRMTTDPTDAEFTGWISVLATHLPRLAAAFGVELAADSVTRVQTAASRALCRSVTLSTMHGCPPEEIESICTYLVRERELDTYVKLNPTLLGFDVVRSILDDLGYDYVQLNPEGFAHDLKYPDAVGILTRLTELAETKARTFGVKLTNTLAVTNTRGRLPGEEMYLSGRALYPIAITLAAKLSREFDGRLPISYCGGIDIHNATKVLSTGIRPLTLCTVLLKPGGFARQSQIAAALELGSGGDPDRINVEALDRLAREALSAPTAEKAFRGTNEVRFSGSLPQTDCYRAPCTEACPIGQHVPEYIRLLGEQRYADALALIYERNALPSITGHICDHQCQHACTRLDYEGAISIRDLKKLAVQEGRAEFEDAWKPPAVTRSQKCAVIGAGPAGLSAAFFLARAGFAVTVYERESHAGGVVRNVIPAFRLPVSAIEDDIQFIERQGVSFVFGAREDQIAVDALREAGFGPIVYSIGAEVGRKLDLTGAGDRMVRSLDFLWGFRGNRDNADIGENVVVVGGGNTAMDAARAALTLPQVKHVSVLYRRSEAEMPADREEYENAIADGAVFQFLRNPESLDADGVLTVRTMELGEPDATGRRRPVATDATVQMHADTIISAIGEQVDEAMLASVGVPRASDGSWVADSATNETTAEDVYLAGDALSGPSTVVRCIAGGRVVANAIAQKADALDGAAESNPATGTIADAGTNASAGSPSNAVAGDHTAPAAAIPGSQAAIDRARERSRIPAIALRDRLTDIRKRKVTVLPIVSSGSDLASREYERCLECSYYCNKCVEVCPNRANIAIGTADEPGFRDPFQIIHLDAYCNECGNCAQFCPWESEVPYRDKPTVFSSGSAFEASSNDGWFVDGSTVRVRVSGEVSESSLNGYAKAPATATAGGGANAGETLRRLFAIAYRDQPSLFEAMS